MESASASSSTVGMVTVVFRAVRHRWYMIVPRDELLSESKDSAACRGASESTILGIVDDCQAEIDRTRSL